MLRMISAILLSASTVLSTPVQAAAPLEPAAFAVDLTVEIDLAVSKARTAGSRLRAVRCVSALNTLDECRLLVSNFLTALDELTDVLARVESKTGVLVFEGVVDRMGDADRRMLTGRYETLIMVVPFPPELAGLSVPADIASKAEATIDRYYATADGIWNPAVFAFGDHLMELISRRGQGVLKIVSPR
ncbi:MAG: hypothetical protein Q7J64_04040 [Elusimicrobiota bacterium]|nr:hypothetical protein [Elusimicrobiota bacterium]